MSANKNLIVALAAVFAFIFLWDHFVASRYRPAPVPATEAAPTRAVDAPPSRDIPEIREATPSREASRPDEAIATIATDQTRAQIVSRGAGILSWQVRENGHWIELVPEAAEGDDPLRNAGLPFQTFPGLNFDVASHDEDGILLTADHPRGFRIEKAYNLAPLPGLHAITLRLTNTGTAPLNVSADLGWGPGLGSRIVGNAEAVENPQDKSRAMAYSDRLQSWAPGVIFNRTVDRVEKGPFDWVGVDNNYFLVAILGGETGIPEVGVTATRDVKPTVIIPASFSLAPGETVERRYTLYAGPKDLDWMASLGHNLDAAVDFGVFGILSKSLLTALEFLKSLTGNYGWAIVILTVLYQALVYPLTKRSLQHSIKMREVQPQLKKIQQQFKSDPKRIQIETFNLYKRHGMKFMGMEGCVPMLIQIPFFFAIYSALQNSYQLRGAEWILWIQNLSAPDPYYILPILMGGASLLQSKLTTVAVDPAQAKMMMIMPIFLVFIFLKMPAGLVLYWTTQSLATIVVQKFLLWKKLHHPQPAG